MPSKKISKSFIKKNVITQYYQDLFDLAWKEPKYSNIIINEIKEIIKKTKIRPNKAQKRLFCNKCGSPFNKSPKIKNKKIIFKCPVCGHICRKKIDS